LERLARVVLFVPIDTPKADLLFPTEKSEELNAEEELMMICGSWRSTRRLDSVMEKKPDVNYKDDDGVAPLRRAAICGSADFMKKLIGAKADTNVPVTADFLTPVEMVTDKFTSQKARDVAFNNWDPVVRLDDACTADKFLVYSYGFSW